MLCVKLAKSMQIAYRAALMGWYDSRCWLGESINTFDQHNDKVYWSIVHPSDADLSAAASWIEQEVGTVVMMMTRLCLFLKAFCVRWKRFLCETIGSIERKKKKKSA